MHIMRLDVNDVNRGRLVVERQAPTSAGREEARPGSRDMATSPTRS
jgi:hypothetical protein